MMSGRLRTVKDDYRRLWEAGAVSGLSDVQLLERFTARRDDLAFAFLVERHGPLVWAVCQSVLRNPHDVEDAFQATFLILARKAHSIWVKDSLCRWLYRVGYRVAQRARANRARLQRRRANPHTSRGSTWLAAGNRRDASHAGPRSAKQANEKTAGRRRRKCFVCSGRRLRGEFASREMSRGDGSRRHCPGKVGPFCRGIRDVSLRAGTRSSMGHVLGESPLPFVPRFGPCSRHVVHDGMASYWTGLGSCPKRAWPVGGPAHTSAERFRAPSARDRVE
jgi:RNA polymerase sigma factor (sigma-70 family)